MLTGRAFIRKFGTAPNGKPLAAVLMMVAGDEIARIPESPLQTGTISTVVGGNLAGMLQLSILPDAIPLEDLMESLDYPDPKRDAIGQTFDSLAREPIWRV